MTLKNPPGIDPGTVRLVAQRLNHYGAPGPPPGQVLKEYCRTEGMGVVTVVIICTAVERKQNFLCRLPRSTDRSCVCLTSVWQFPSVLGNKLFYWILPLRNQTQTLAWLIGFPVKIIVLDKRDTKIPIKNNGFRELKYIIPPLRVFGHVAKTMFRTGLSVYCLTEGWHAFIVRVLVQMFGNIMKWHCYDSREIKLSNYCLQNTIPLLHIRVYLNIQGVPGGMCQTSGGCSLC
jgi:hypothetical protein